ncbi:MAG: gamma-glutamyltransferase [Thiogranum sp.]|jgi:gamma-glutamyltranspeptidase/glutathione hydrolase|nr:gamma-glutamyltransferase [Thiogranum sp.]
MAWHSFPRAKRLRFGAFLLCVLALSGGARSASAAAPVKPPAQAVASAHPLATEAGQAILGAGGNAFDAAIAVSAALAVVEPYSSGIGGGGFWLLHRASDGRQVMIDGRERAPLAADRDLYLDESGAVVPGLSMDGPLAAAIPGEPAALAHLATHYGRLPLADSLAPAIRLAEQGFAVDEHYRRLAAFRLQVLQRFAGTARIFLHRNEVPPLGTVIRQPDLATTLRALAGQGRDGFYAGKVGALLVQGVREAGGIWTKADLAAYRVVEREPIRFDYRDLHIVSAAPPSSGGVALATMLHILEGYPLTRLDEAAQVHLIVEAMRRAYRDRAQYLGDPDFVSIPVQELIHPWYAAGLRASIRPDRATPSASLAAAEPAPAGNHTTHFSILDRDGNRVAATLSVNYPFGSGFVAPGTGVLLNDEMDDFSAKPGVPNAYGLVGAEANAIAPGKRPLSSMTPTFVESERGVAILGTPGGSRIITMVLLGILDLEAGRGPASWVARPRFHHQYLPDLIEYEPEAFSDEVLDALAARGHRLKQLARDYGNMQAIYWDYARQRVEAASDPRGIGRAEVR